MKLRNWLQALPDCYLQPVSLSWHTHIWEQNWHKTHSWLYSFKSTHLWKMLLKYITPCNPLLVGPTTALGTQK